MPKRYGLDISTFIVVSVVWLAIVSSLACVVFMAMLLKEGYNTRERALQRGALLYFLCFSGMYFGRLFYKWYPELFTMLEPLIYACHTCLGVAFYYIVFKMTADRDKSRFSRIHIVLALAIPVILAIWMLFVPFEVPLGIVRGMRELNPEWPVFSNVFASVMPAELLFVGGYLILSFVRLHRYHRSLPERKKESTRYRMRWIYVMAALICIAWLHPLTALVTSLEETYAAYWFLAPTVLAIISMQAILLYNLQQHNYPPLDIKVYSNPEKSQMRKNARKKMVQLSRKDFDLYFRQEKPYLDPQLKLTSLAEALGVDRGELSRFINRTYKVNFSVFVNSWRFKEVERLRQLDENKAVTLKSLLPRAGFASYNSFMRARQQAEGERISENEHSE